MKRNKTLSVLTALALALTLLPAAALADGGWTNAATADALVAALAAGGNVRLSANVTLGADHWPAVGEGKTATLDLNGHTLTSVNDISVYGALTLTDGGSGGRFVFSNEANPNYGIYVSYGGKLTMSGGTISGFIYGVGLFNNDERRGSFTMTGGAITGCDTGVSLDEGSTFTMTGGRISDNSYGVSVGSGAAFTMTGGRISDNAWGVSVGSGAFSVSGEPVVSGNRDDYGTARDVFLGDTAIRVTGKLGAGASLGVHSETDGFTAAQAVDYNGGKLTAADAAKFFSDSSRWNLRLADNGTLTLAEAPAYIEGYFYVAEGEEYDGLATLNYSAKLPADANTLVIAAAYDAEGRLLEVQTDDRNAIDGGFVLPHAEGYTYRLMLADGGTFAPLCPAWRGQP